MELRNGIFVSQLYRLDVFGVVYIYNRFIKVLYNFLCMLRLNVVLSGGFYELIIKI